MKKLLAILLALVMVLPMTLVASAETVTEMPFYGGGWSAVDKTKIDNIYGLCTINTIRKNDNVHFEHPVRGENGVDITKTVSGAGSVAASVKKEMDSRPEGLRYLHISQPSHALRIGAKDVIDLAVGVEKLKTITAEFLREYKKIGGKLEGLVIDLEFQGTSANDLISASRSNPMVFNEIVQSDVYKKEIRPLLEERGFKFYPNPTEHTPEIWGIASDDDQYASNADIWNMAVRIHLNNYLDYAVFDLALELYPDIVVSDYGSNRINSWYKIQNNVGKKVYLAGNGTYAGNAVDVVDYFDKPAKSYYESAGGYVYKNPESFVRTVYADLPFNMFRWNINDFKQTLASCEDGHLTAWIAEYDYTKDRPGSVCNTPYYTETLYHIGMLNPEPFLVYMYRPDFGSEEDYYSRVEVISEIFDELTRVAGYSDRKNIPLPVNWNYGFMLSGMYANSRNIWRISPDTSNGMTLENFKVEGNDPTFYIDGQTVTFPGGKIIEDSKISVVGSCGYWVETDKDVLPVITTDADRYQKAPAYMENFESYKLDSQYSIQEVPHKATWLLQTKSKDKPVIVSDGEDQAIEMTGTTYLLNEKLPANITGGDYYAENQEWRVTATIPAGMGDKEEIILLNYEGAAQDEDDGGFKIANGKVYYAKGGDYEEIPNLDVSAGGKYTFKRVMHFAEDSFTSDYYVLNAEGKPVAIVKDIPVSVCNLPVATIFLGCKNLKGKLLLDDYSLNAYGTHADFELFEAEYGVMLDATKTQSTDTAYRLSWLNPSANTETTAKIVAEFYEGDKKVSEEVVKELKMAPGCDGVETGIVEVKDGQSVKLTLLTEDKKLNNDDETVIGGNTGDNNNDNHDNNSNTGNAGNTGNTGKKPAGISIGVIAIIAAAAVSVIVVVLALVLTGKPKKAKVKEEAPAEEAASEETETPDAE